MEMDQQRIRTLFARRGIQQRGTEPQRDTDAERNSEHRFPQRHRRC